jgi:hypothetical protein
MDTPLTEVETQKESWESRIVFTRKVSRSGKSMTKIISIPLSLRDLVQYGKTYKITLEEIPNDR